MAGHSKWKNIQHRKGLQDAKKGKIFTKLLKEITVSVKTGGADPESNPRLRSAMIACREANMPKDNIERAIKKANGADAQNFVEVTFEGYGPEGVAIFVECATDNNTRTVSNIRSYFNKYGGSLGKDGCLEFIFKRQGIFILDNAVENVNSKIVFEDFFLEMIENQADDVQQEGDSFFITCEVENFGTVQKALSEKGLKVTQSQLVRTPSLYKKIEGPSLEKFQKLLSALEEDEDVQEVFHNVDFSEEE